MWELIEKGLANNGLVTAFAFVGVVMWISVVLSKRLTFGRIHGSAIAIVIGLVLAWVGGTLTGGQKGLADVALFSGIGLMGGAMLRDFAIVATAFEVQATEARKAGLIGAIALLLGTVLPCYCGREYRLGVWLSRCDQHDHHRCGRGDLHRRAGDRGGAGCKLGCGGAVHRDWADQGDSGDGGHAHGGTLDGPG